MEKQYLHPNHRSIRAQIRCSYLLHFKYVNLRQKYGSMSEKRPSPATRAQATHNKTFS